MALIFSLVFTTLMCFSQITLATDFNFGSGQAAKSENAKDALITAMEISGNRIYAVGVHGIVIYSDDEEIVGHKQSLFHTPIPLLISVALL